MGLRRRRVHRGHGGRCFHPVDNPSLLRDETLALAVGSLGIFLQIPAHRGQSFRRIADSNPVIADSF
jgi:hypothetical protein